jgi:hypothetical protein
VSTPNLKFVEATPSAWSHERDKLLADKITDLGLKIEGTYLERVIARLYEELDQAGIQLKPTVYLAEEWACPDGVPVIGIPFYLADPRLARIEDELMDGVEAESEQDILSYLRHEAGHAFNYAYKLYESGPWRELFGDMSLPYNDVYTPRPFSRNFVRHIPGWYAQKHPDEDFAETFAVWLTPSSNWRELYKGWGCYKKLLYVDSIVQQLGSSAPVVTGEDYDFASEALVYSVAEHYRRMLPELTQLPAQLDHELAFVFRSRTTAGTALHSGAQHAHEWLTEQRRSVVQRIAYWTGLNDVDVKSLMNHLIERAKLLELTLDRSRGPEVLIDFVAFMTTLCMNRLYQGEFVFNEGHHA